MGLLGLQDVLRARELRREMDCSSPIIVDMKKYGPFHYTGESGFEAWGYRFPSGFVVMEWISESAPDDKTVLAEGHQSIYHDWNDFRAVCEGEISWGEHA